MRAHFKIITILLLCFLLQGCLGSIIGTTVDVAVEVIKVPFKVGGAVIDVVSGEDFTDVSSQQLEAPASDADIQKLESQGLH